MSTLPPALCTWGPELEGLALDLLDDLQPWLLRVASAVGPLRSHHQRGQGAPDGFDGLTRKGPYARLLATEWLLAEHYPDEFLRRAAQAEHLFYDLATEVPAGHRSCAALFDGGPEQWGAPRILQLALLITLARRARLAQVQFKWGIVQDAAPALIEGLSPQSALKLLQGRNYALPDARHLESWRAHLDGLDVPVDETWWIGSPSLVALAPAQDRVAETTEPLSLTDRQVVLRLGPPHPRQLELTLPATKRCVRLLRNPFEVHDTRSHLFEGGVVQDLLFSVDGRTLFAWGEHGLHAHVVPPAGAPPAPPLKLASPDERPVAMGRARKRHLVILSGTNYLSVVPFSKRGTRCEVTLIPLSGAIETIAESDGRPRLSPCVVVGRAQDQNLLVLDGEGRALRLPQGKGSARVLSHYVTGLSRSMGGAALVIARRAESEADLDNGAQLALTYRGRAMTQGDLPVRAIVICDGYNVRRIVHLPEGAGDYLSLFSQSTVAVRIEPDLWTLHTKDASCDVRVPDGHQVLGPWWSPVPGLVTLAPDAHTVHLCVHSEVKELAKSPVDLSKALLSPRGPIVAYRTPKGGFRVDELSSGRVLMACSPGAS